MVVDRRAELVEAGLRLLAELRFEDVLDAVETKAIAEAAGVTTGSFFHHFRNREHFALAVVRRWEELWSARVDRLVSHAVVAAEDQREGGYRDAAEAEWAALSAPGAMESVQRLLWGLRDQPVADGEQETAGELLARSYEQLAAQVRADYSRGLRAMGREPMPPFDQHDMEVVTTALAEGLQLRAGVDPSAVRADLYRDAVSAFLLGSTRPRRVRGEECGDDDVDLARMARRLGRPAAEPTDARSDEPVERWRQIADAAASLFVDRSPQQVRLSEVAAAAGVGAELVRHEFESVVAVAAAGWARHVGELEAIAAEHDGDDPLRRVEAVLLRYVELVRANRGAGEALVAQVLFEAGPGADEAKHDIRALVPLPRLLAPSIEELRRAGRLRRGTEILRLARSLVHLVTVQALLVSEESVERVVDEVLALVFDGALVEPSDG